MIKRGKRYSILSAVGLCVRCSAGVSVAVMLLYLFQGLTPALLTLATGAFIDAAIGLLRSGEYADVGRALTAVSLLVSFDWISNQLLDLLVGRLRIDVRERFGTEMVEKVADLRYRYVENPESWDLITKISTGASSDTAFFENHRSTICFRGHRIATCLYRTPMGGCIEKTVAFYIPHNLKIIKYAQRSLLPSPGANERCFFVYNERRYP